MSELKNVVVTGVSRGLGLAIAQRVCVMQSWRLEVLSPVAEGHGTCFTLAFA